MIDIQWHDRGSRLRRTTTSLVSILLFSVLVPLAFSTAFMVVTLLSSNDRSYPTILRRFILLWCRDLSAYLRWSTTWDAWLPTALLMLALPCTVLSFLDSAVAIYPERNAENQGRRHNASHLERDMQWLSPGVLLRSG